MLHAIALIWDILDGLFSDAVINIIALAFQAVNLLLNIFVFQINSNNECRGLRILRKTTLYCDACYYSSVKNVENWVFGISVQNWLIYFEIANERRRNLEFEQEEKET